MEAAGMRSGLRKRAVSCRSEKGVALLMVLWIMTILMVIVLSFSYTARTETYSTMSFKEGQEKKFLAEAGIERAVMELFYRKQNISVPDSGAWKTDGTLNSGDLGGGNYAARIIDESGKIDINTLNDSSGIILKNLLMNAGVRDVDADTIVDSVLDWKDADDLVRLHGAESDYYMSLPNPYKAKNANFDTLEELLLVKGMTPAILYGSGESRGIIDFLTVFSKSPIINVNAAPKEVLLAIPGMVPEVVDAVISYRANAKINNVAEVGITAQSSQYLNVVEGNTFTIESVGNKGEGKSGYGIKAVVVLGSNDFNYLYYKKPVELKR